MKTNTMIVIYLVVILGIIVGAASCGSRKKQLDGPTNVMMKSEPKRPKENNLC